MASVGGHGRPAHTPSPTAAASAWLPRLLLKPSERGRHRIALAALLTAPVGQCVAVPTAVVDLSPREVELPDPAPATCTVRRQATCEPPT